MVELGNKLSNKFKSGSLSKVAQKWLDENYPEESTYKGVIDLKNRGKKREEIKELKIKNKFLKGQLDLKGFVNLKKLDCSDNKITSLNVRDLTKLEYLNCSGNEISKLDLSENTEIKTLYCKDQKNNSLEKIVGLEKLRKLTFVDSVPFNFITDELGKNIDNAKKLLGEYKDLIDNEIGSYQRTIDSEVFSQTEKNESGSEVDKYQTQIEQVNNLIDKWK